METPKFEEFGELEPVKIAMQIADTFAEGQPLSQILLACLMVSLFVLNKILEGAPERIKEGFADLRDTLGAYLDIGCRAEIAKKAKQVVH